MAVNTPLLPLQQSRTRREAFISQHLQKLLMSAFLHHLTRTTQSPSNNVRRFQTIPPERRHHSPKILARIPDKPAHAPMITRNPTPLRIIQDGSCAPLINNIVLGILQVGFFLFPEKEDAEVAEQRSELVGDVLERFGFLLERVYQVCFELYGCFGDGEAGNLLETAEEAGFVGAIVWSAEEQDGVCAGIYGL